MTTSELADIGAKFTPETDGVLKIVLNAFADLIGTTFSTVSRDADFQAALASLSQAGTEVFNRETPDVMGVHYESWAGVSSKIAKWPADIEIVCGNVLAHEAKPLGFGADLMDAPLIPLSFAFERRTMEW